MPCAVNRVPCAEKSQLCQKDLKNKKVLFLSKHLRIYFNIKLWEEHLNTAKQPK
jgi:hypothetical protein